MRTISLSLALLFGLNLNAVELEVVTGRAKGSCLSSDLSLLKRAQQDTIRKAGSQKTRVSDWNQLAFERGFAYAPELCKYKGAWSEALFVKKELESEPLFLSLDFGISNKRIDPETPGQNILTDQEAWNQAIQKNGEYALKFCQSVKLDRVMSKTKKIFNGRSWYDYFKVKVRFQCEI